MIAGSQLSLVILLASSAVACSKSGDGNKGKESGAGSSASSGVSTATAPPLERTDVIGRDGAPLTLVGKTPEVGDMAPVFELVDKDMEPVASTSFAGKLIVLSVVPSIDTRVCEAQTHAVDGARGRLPEGAVLLTVSRDLPFAQRRFWEEAVMNTAIASDYKGGDFGRAFGLVVKENGLLARSVWVIGKDGRIKYRELVANQASEPDYERLVAAANEAASL